MRSIWCLAMALLGANSVLAQEPAGTGGALDQQLEAVRRVTAVYRDVDAAKRAGYVLFRAAMDAPLMGEHWVNQQLLEQPVDLSRPAVLQYTRVGDERVLVGVTYGHWQRPGESLPEGFVGASDRWHVHNMPELVHQLTRHQPWYVRWAADRRIESRGMTGPDGRPELAMLHVWLWSDNPDGRFANYNPALPYLRAGLPTAWARPGGHAAARGIELLDPAACDRAVDRTRRIVGADRTQRQALRETCARAAAQVAAARGQGVHGDALNLVAARAWQDFAKNTLATLTLGQRQELASLRGGMGMGLEHDHAGHAH